ncbi:MAG: TetR/AcrR family transcriptional regulator [Tabrizicola sp.]|nr:TetR/AcrR family transcriptional regulator [Tabrizicola sp.]
MTRKPQARTAQTRDRLVAAARDIVAETGLAGLRTEAVVARAATAKGTFFAHFPDKDHLLALLLAEILRAEVAQLAVPASREQLADNLDRVFAAFSSEPERLTLLVRFSGPVGVGLGIDEVIHDVIAGFAGGLAGMQARGMIAPGGDPALLGEGLVAFLFHAAASAQCPLTTMDKDAARRRAQVLLHRLTDALLWPGTESAGKAARSGG